MSRSRIQTGALMAVGLVLALVVYFWQAGAPEEEQPVTSAVPASPSPSPSEESPAGREPSMEPSPSESPWSRVPVAASPSPSMAASATPTAGGRTVAPRESSTPAQVVTPRADVRAITGLAVGRNNHRSVTVRWAPAAATAQYAVYLNGSRIATVGETSATIIWESPSVTVGVAAVGPNGAGPMSTIRVQRPAGAPTTAPVRETRPVQPPVRQDPPPTTTRPVEPVQPAPEPEPDPPAPPAPAPDPEPPLPDPEPAPREPQVIPVPTDEPTAPAGEIVPGPVADPSNEP